jgi:hypothetical protein
MQLAMARMRATWPDHSCALQRLSMVACETNGKHSGAGYSRKQLEKNIM